MKLQHPEVFETTVRVRYLLVVSVALVLAAVGAACRQEQQANSNGTSNPASVSPQATPPPVKKRDLGETPIVITGGSILLDFNNSTFNLCTGSTAPPTPCPSPTPGNVMYWADGKIASGYYYNDNPNGNDTENPITIDPANFTMTIEGKDGSDTGTIVIRNDPATTRVYIEFDETNKFKVHHAGSPRRTNKKFRIDKLWVNKGGTGEKDYTAEATWPQNNKATVELYGGR
jgi:hypothetical protein